MSVEVRTKAILKETRRTDEGSAWLFFETKSRGLDARTGLKAALQRVGISGEPDDSYATEVGEPVAHPKGAVLFVQNTHEDDRFPGVLEDVATDLSDAGFSGVIRVVSPEWSMVDDSQRKFECISAMMRLDTGPWKTPVGERREPSWSRDPAATRTLIASLVKWAVLPDATHILGCGRVRFRAPADDLVDLVAAGLRTGEHTQVVSQVNEDTIRRFFLRPWGDVVIEARSNLGTATWLADVQGVRTALVDCSADGVGFGCIKRSHMDKYSWVEMLSVGWPLEPPTAIGKFARLDNPAIRLDEFVPDAFGIQVLTEAHISRLGQLESWNVEKVAGDHFLVSHTDQLGWFADSGPDPALLTAARADFAPILLTAEQVDLYRGLHSPTTTK